LLYRMSVLPKGGRTLHFSEVYYKNQNEADLKIRGKIIEPNKNNALCDYPFLG
jgi:hypothetical protein